MVSKAQELCHLLCLLFTRLMTLLVNGVFALNPRFIFPVPIFFRYKVAANAISRVPDTTPLKLSKKLKVEKKKKLLLLNSTKINI